MEWPGTLESVEEADIETRAGDDAPVHRTTIWPVVADGEVYVRSLRGAAGRWYRELRANPDAVLHAGGQSLPVRGVAADDPGSIERTTAGFRRKYADSPYMESMIRDEIVDTTVRLDRR